MKAPCQGNYWYMKTPCQGNYWDQKTPCQGNYWDIKSHIWDMIGIFLSHAWVWKHFPIWEIHTKGIPQISHFLPTWELPKVSCVHVDISPDHQKYLGFAWPFNGVLRYLTFAVLPFGLSSLCFCFTKLLRPLVKRW